MNDAAVQCCIKIFDINLFSNPAANQFGHVRTFFLSAVCRLKCRFIADDEEGTGGEHEPPFRTQIFVHD